MSFIFGVVVGFCVGVALVNSILVYVISKGIWK